jgi:peptidyl-prolyl cis-trans isomerase B (cyclophilin B)
MLKISVIAATLVFGILLMTGCRKDESSNPKVMLETTKGKIELELFPDVAPKHVENFLALVNQGFYDSLIFHRVVDGFMIQGGDPTGTGRGGSGKTIPAEFNDSLHYPGTLAMARAQDPNSASSQFYICLARLPRLDHQYTVFGKTISGMDVVRAIGKTPTSGSRERIARDSTWRAELMRMKDEEGADVVSYPDGTIMPDRPLEPVRILKAYVEKK